MDYYVVYSLYALNATDDKIVDRALDVLYEGSLTNEEWFVRYYAIDGINRIRDGYKEELADSGENGSPAIQARLDKVNSLLKRIQEQTEDNELQSLFSE